MEGGFSFYWSGNFCLSFVYSTASFLTPFLVLGQTRSPIWAGIAAASGVMARFAAPTFLGGMSDRLGIKKILLVFSSLTVLLCLGLVAISQGKIGLLVLCLIRFALGTAYTALTFGTTVAVPHLVSKDHLLKANSNLMTGTYAAELIGPLAAGWASMNWGMAPILIFCSGLSALGAALFLAIHFPQFQTANQTPLDLSIGWKFFQEKSEASRKLLALMEMNFFCYVGLYVLYALFNFYCASVLNLTNAIIGFMNAASKAFGIIISTLTPWMEKRFGEGILLAASAISLIGSLILMAFVSSALGCAAALCLAMVPQAIITIIARVLRQRLLPQEIIGRVSGFYSTIAVGSSTILSPFSGFGAVFLGYPALFIATAILCSAGIIWSGPRIWMQDAGNSQ